jgi:HemY protein
MRRLALFLALTGLLVAGAVWLADRPGEVTIHWQGWRVDTTVPVLLAAILALMALISFVLRLLRGLLGGPARLLSGWRSRRTKDGYLALAHGMAAVAAGQGKQALKLAKKADRLLKDPGLTGLLGAQAAQLAGDRDGLRPRYLALSERPETAFIGFKGLMELELADGNPDAAKEAGAKALAINPKSAELAQALARLYLESAQWDEAAKAAAQLEPDQGGARLLALAAYGRALTSHLLDDAVTAAKHDLSLAPAVALAARLYLGAGKPAKGEDLVLKAFARSAHPQLVEAWAELGLGASDLAQVKRMERLVKTNTAAPEGHVALAEAALKARLWGEARHHLEIAHGLRPSHRVLELLARLERQERKDEAAATGWLAQAPLAKPDPTWVCSDCGHRTDAFAVTCPACGRAAVLDWS